MEFDEILGICQEWGQENACPVAHGDSFGQRPPHPMSIPAHLDFWLIVWPADEDHDTVDLELGAKDAEQWQTLMTSLYGAFEENTDDAPEAPEVDDKTGFRQGTYSIST